MTFAILIALLNYLTWPVEPMMAEKGYELREIVGMPVFYNTSDPHLKVNRMDLKCDIEGSGGCGFYKNLVNTKIPARIRYISMPWLLWGHYNVLYSLEQDGKTIISPEQLRARYSSHYSNSLETHRFSMYFWIPILALIWLSDFSGFAQYRQTFFTESRKK